MTSALQHADGITLTQSEKEIMGNTKDKSSAATPQIWNSRISWRIALSVFLTILIVQVGILTLTVKQKELFFLNEIQQNGLATFSGALSSASDTGGKNPISGAAANHILNTANIHGFSIYTPQFELLGLYGDPVSIIPKTMEDLSQTYRSENKGNYEVVYKPKDLLKPYIIVGKLGTESIGSQIISYVKETVYIMFLLSAFVTVVLMIALGKWLLEPILFLRANLLSASKNPETPKIQDSPFSTDDEIGGAIALAQKLIKQNAENIWQIKSAAEDKIHKLAYYDTLTGLPNRTLFSQKLAELSRQVEQEEHKTPRFAVVAMDLDHFKDINDSMGHSVGDAILRSVAKRLRTALPETALVARSGEDEFAITVPLVTDINNARDVAEKMRHVIAGEPFKVFNEEFQIRSSVGVATFPDDSIDPDQVLKNADIALNRAKEEGRNTVKEYSEDFDRAVQQRFQMLRDLRDAMDNDELSLYYQPQFDLNSGKIIGAEALMRWFKKDNSKDGGSFISPAEFIPIAEQSGLIVPMGEWVIREACLKAMAWKKTGHDIRIAVNVSGAQFYQSDLVSYVSRVLKETKLPPHHLELEVTESIFMDDVAHTIETLKQLHGLGVELAIDDFGTGYSSLSYLRQFPIDRLKIDQSFIRNALNDQSDASIARTIVGLGHSLNLKVIAEGVETKEHEDFLRKERCDEVQGFRYSKPIPNDEFVVFLKNYNDDLNSFDR